MKKSSIFDAYTAFLNLKIVRFVSLVMGAAGALLAGWIVCFSELESDFSYVGVNHLIEVFKVPLSIWALLIPLLALFAANHRSEQAKESMSLATKQNWLSNHFKKLEEFEKYVEKIKKVNAEMVEGLSLDSRLLYSVLFPNSEIESRPIPKETTDSFRTTMGKISFICERFADDPNNKMQALFRIRGHREYCFDMFKNAIIPTPDGKKPVGKWLSYGEEKLWFSGASAEYYLWETVRIFNYYHLLMKFDIKYDGGFCDRHIYAICGMMDINLSDFDLAKERPYSFGKL